MSGSAKASPRNHQYVIQSRSIERRRKAALPFAALGSSHANVAAGPACLLAHLGGSGTSTVDQMAISMISSGGNR
jgi:hypothetical protein